MASPLQIKIELGGKFTPGHITWILTLVTASICVAAAPTIAAMPGDMKRSFYESSLDAEDVQRQYELAQAMGQARGGAAGGVPMPPELEGPETASVAEADASGATTRSDAQESMPSAMRELGIRNPSVALAERIQKLEARIASIMGKAEVQIEGITEAEVRELFRLAGVTPITE